MALLSDAEIRRLERKHVAGVSSAAIVEAFQGKGARFSEATLRKYVQLGLLPKSHRVGTRGRHRGSSGLYPVIVLRLINDIKQALDAGATLEEVRYGKIGLGGELAVLRLTTAQVLSRFRAAVERQSERTVRGELKRMLEAHRRELDGTMRQLDKFATRLARRPGV